MSKKLINLLRHGSPPREEDGAIGFWRIKDYLQDRFVHSRHWSDEKWKSIMAKGGGNKEQFQYCADSSGAILYLRALQGHSGRNLIDPSLQDNVLIPDDFFKYIYHVGCAINLHSIINSGLIPGGQNLSKRQTVFFLPVNPMDKEHKDPETIDLKAPRLVQNMHTAWKKHQNTVYWVDIRLAQKKGLKFYQTRSNAIILYNTLPAYCIPKTIKMETGEIIYEKEHESPRPPQKISLRNDWMKEVGPEVARQAEGSQPTQPNPNPIHRTRRPVVTEQTSRSSAQEIDTRFSLDCENTNLLFERLEKDKDTDKDVDADREECLPLEFFMALQSTFSAVHYTQFLVERIAVIGVCVGPFFEFVLWLSGSTYFRDFVYQVFEHALTVTFKCRRASGLFETERTCSILGVGRRFTWFAERQVCRVGSFVVNNIVPCLSFNN